MVDSMNNYFCEIGEKLSRKVNLAPTDNIKLPKENPNTIFLEPTYANEIIRIIKEMKDKLNNQFGLTH